MPIPTEFFMLLLGPFRKAPGVLP